MAVAAHDEGLVIGRYVVFDEIASGGMATVHLGRLVGAVGFARTVAIKRLHKHLAGDDDFTAMFLDEARLAARIRHPNVVAVLDVVHEAGELFLVMDYVQGEPLSRLIRASRPGVVPPRIAVTIATCVLHGLHAAHEATNEHGEPMGIVHRDVSPQNVMVGIDGVARVLDFGIAKATHRAQTTQDGTVKGKISYMAPEQLLSEHVDRRADVYSAAVVLWETVTGERLFEGDNQGRVIRKILDEPVPRPSSVAPGLPAAIDDAIMRGLERDPTRRWQSARDFAAALERALPAASLSEIGEWVESIGGAALDDRRRRVKDIESRSDILAVRAAAPTRIDTPSRKAMTSGPTAAQAFAVMSTQPGDDPGALVSSAPPPISSVVPAAPRDGGLTVATPRSVPKLAVPSPLAPLAPVQTVAVTPLATLEEALAKRRSSKKPLVIGLALALVGLLAAAFAVTWTLLHR